MFNLSGSEIIVILLLALVVLGPEKLPDAIRRAGKAYADLRKMATSFQSEMRSVIDEPMNEMRETADMLRDATNFSDDGSGATRRPGSAPTTPASTPPEPASTPPQPVGTPPEPAPDAAHPASGDGDAEDDLITRTLSGDFEPPASPGSAPTT